MTPHAIIERRSFPPRPASFTDLPFVADIKVGPRKTARYFWHVPDSGDYGQANNIGRQFAADYAQYLKDNPFWVGAGFLGRIVADMAKHQDSSANGYGVGFCSFIEQLLFLAATQWDVYALAEAECRAISEGEAA